MALNSTNRFASLSAEAAETRFLVEQAEAAEQNAIKESSGYLEEIEIPKTYTNLQEAYLSISKNDLNVFNSCIELEFLSAANESAGLLTESVQNRMDVKTVNKILEQVSIVSENAKKAIQASGLNFISVAEDMHESDAKIYEKYINAIKENGIDGYRGTENFSFPTLESADGIDSLINVKDVTDVVNTVTNDIDKAISKKAVQECCNAFTEYLGKIRGKAFECVKGLCKCHETWIPDEMDIAVMEGYAKNTRPVYDSINLAVYEACKCIDDTTAKITEAIKAHSDDKSKARAFYTIESGVCKDMISAYNEFRNMEVREIASYRASIINCGKYAIKSGNGIHESVDLQSVNESSVIENSNLYVFEAFED